MLLPERDDHVELVLRNWDALHALFRLPMPPDPDVTRRLRHKETLPAEAERAGVDAPATVAADSEETLRSLELRPPYLLKPVEGQHFAGSFGVKVIEADTLDELLAAWREARARGFETVVQELIPEAHEKIWSLFAYIGQSGRHARDRHGREGAARADPVRDERRIPHRSRSRASAILAYACSRQRATAASATSSSRTTTATTSSSCSRSTRACRCGPASR